MSLYVLTADEWWQEVDRTPTCSECGTVRGDRVVERTRHRKGDQVEVSGPDEARLLAAGAILPIDDDEPKPEPEPDDEADADADRDPDDYVPSAVSALADAEARLVEARAAGAPKRPAQVAPKAEWVDYVVAAGLVNTADEAEEMNKAELIGIAK